MSNEEIWDGKVENLSEGGNSEDYFTPEQGNQEIKFLDDGTFYDDQKKFDDEENDYVKFRVMVDGEEKKWDMKEAGTPNSKFGQIARYRKKKDGLEGETVTWFRQGEGQQTNHVLMDLTSDGDGSGEDVIFDDDDEVK